MKDFLIRSIEKRDSKALFELRNLDSDLKYFQNPKLVSKLDHEAWIENRVQSCRDFTLVLEASNVVVGVAYVNSLVDAEIAIRINPLFRSQGYASLLLRRLEDSLVDINVPLVIAVIHRENQRSIDFFESAEYRPFEIDYQESFIKFRKALASKNDL